MITALGIWLALGLCSYALLLRGWWRERCFREIPWWGYLTAFMLFVVMGPIMGLAWIGEERDQ